MTIDYLHWRRRGIVGLTKELALLASRKKLGL